MRVASETSFSAEIRDGYLSEAESLGVFDAFAPEVSTRSTGPAITDGSDGADVEAAVKQRFAQEFTRLAQDPAGFHALMRQVYGSGYDVKAAEQMRQRALSGDFSWLPEVRLVGADTLGGANGAYDSKSGVVYLNAALAGDVETLAQTYLEEVGHHLDTRLNRTDSRGDEGELFRRLLAGERLSGAQIEEVRAENDHGTIVVDGRAVEVEFWNPFKAAANAVKAVGNAVVSGAKAVAGAVADAAVAVGTGVYNAGRSLVEGTWDFVKQAAVGTFHGVGDFFSSLVRLDLSGMVGAVGRLVDNLIFKAPMRLVTGAINALEHGLDAAINVIPFDFIRKPLHNLADRFFDAGRTIVTGVLDIGAGIRRNLFEAAETFVEGIDKIFRGDFLAGLGDMGKALLKAGPQTVADVVLFTLGKAASVVQTLLGFEKPGRHLTEGEKAELRKIFGDSIDYDAVLIKEGKAGLFSGNDRAFVLGNTIYIKDNRDDPSTPQLDHMPTLVSEMTHIWQFQNGGTDYAGEAIISQNWGKGYDWRQSVPGTPWGGLEPEQQDAFLNFAYVNGAFNSDPPVLVLDYNGDGVLDDLSGYLRAALADIRAGRGAP